MTDAADVRAILRSRSEPQAFAEIFERHHDSIRRYLVRRLGDPGNDLAAEVFVRAYSARARFDPSQGTVRPWLFGIAANLIRRHRRDERRRLASLARIPAEPRHDRDPASQPVAAGDRGLLFATLLRLSRGDRETLLLYAWGELSYAEIAAALDVPVGTVRSRIARARSRLQRELSAGTGQEPDANPDPPAINGDRHERLAERA